MAQLIGEKVEAPNKAIVRLDNLEYQFSKSIQGLIMPEGINPRDYAMIHSLRREGYNVFCDADSAISMTQGFNGLRYFPAHVEVLKSGLAISTLAQFMPYLRNVNDALRGEGVLYDAAGNLIEGDRLRNHAHTLNYNHWAWQNAGFKKGSGFLKLDLVTVSGLDGKGNLTEIFSPLEDCLENDGWAELESLNSQGLPTRKAKIGEYEPGKTFYFWKPKRDLVARSGAGSYRLLLSCYRNPSNWDPSLGVFSVFNVGSLARQQD